MYLHRDFPRDSPFDFHYLYSAVWYMCMTCNLPLVWMGNCSFSITIAIADIIIMWLLMVASSYH